MVRATIIFFLRYDPLLVFRTQNHVTFIFIKTMSPDLLVQCLGCDISQFSTSLLAEVFPPW